MNTVQNDSAYGNFDEYLFCASGYRTYLFFLPVLSLIPFYAVRAGEAPHLRIWQVRAERHCRSGASSIPTYREDG